MPSPVVFTRCSPDLIVEIDRLCFPSDDPVDIQYVHWCGILYELGPLVAQAIGYTTMYRVPGPHTDRWELVRYGIRPEWRRLGYGRYLARKRPRGAERIDTYTIANPPSEAALRTAGYVKSGIRYGSHRERLRLWRWTA